MAWVTKTSDEQYTPEPAPREYTKQEKAANWWHYNKIIVLVVIIIAAVVAWIVHDMMSTWTPTWRSAMWVHRACPPTRWKRCRTP